MNKINRQKAIDTLVEAGYSASYAAELADQVITMATGKHVPGITRGADMGRAALLIADAFANGQLNTSGKLRLIVTALRTIV